MCFKAVITLLNYMRGELWSRRKPPMKSIDMSPPHSCVGQRMNTLRGSGTAADLFDLKCNLCDMLRRSLSFFASHHIASHGSAVQR
jgi:hypothetical protein